MPRIQPRWAVSFQATETLRDAEREQQGTPCARGEHCASGARERADDGTWHREPALCPRAFCETDRSIIGQCLTAFPALHCRLSALTGTFLTAEVLVRAPFGPSVPLRVDVDELMRLIVDVACSWHERVADVARLSVPDTQVTRRIQLGMRAGTLLGPACHILGAHLDTLLGLEHGPVTRPASSCLSVIVPDAEVAGAWSDTVMLMLSGADAGNEIMRLDYLARSALLETEPAPVRLLGVPCRGCGKAALQRAAPAQHDGDPEFYSVCVLCGDALDDAEYKRWVGMNAKYVETRTPAQLAASMVA